MLAAFVSLNSTLITQPLTNPTRPRGAPTAGDVSGTTAGARFFGMSDIASRANFGSHFSAPSERMILGGSSAHFSRAGNGKIFSIAIRRKNRWNIERG